jgi:hypothetical protein
MNYSPTAVKPSSRSRERSRQRHLRVALTLLVFALAVLFGGVGLLARAAALGGASRQQAVVTHDAHPSTKSRCGKARAVTHAKHVRAHARSASVDDDDDDDDDGVGDSFAIALDQTALAPARFRVPESAAWELDAAAPEPASRPRRSRAQSAHEARGPPAA